MVLQEMVDLVRQHHPDIGLEEVIRMLNRAQDDFTMRTKMIKEGDKIPQHKFIIRKHLSPEIACTFNEPIGEWGWLSTEEMFDNKRIVLFGVPGAFTPTCGKIHLPKFEMYYRKILSFGIDEIYCTAVNDPFVMDHWYRMNGVSYVKAAPDGSGEFADKLGMSADMSYLNYGKRTWRYSMLVNNGIVEKLFVLNSFDIKMFLKSSQEVYKLSLPANSAAPPPSI